MLNLAKWAEKEGPKGYYGVMKHSSFMITVNSNVSPVSDEEEAEIKEAMLQAFNDVWGYDGGRYDLPERTAEERWDSLDSILDFYEDTNPRSSYPVITSLRDAIPPTLREDPMFHPFRMRAAFKFEIGGYQNRLHMHIRWVVSHATRFAINKKKLKNIFRNRLNEIGINEFHIQIQHSYATRYGKWYINKEELVPLLRRDYPTF